MQNCQDAYFATFPSFAELLGYQQQVNDRSTWTHCAVNQLHVEPLNRNSSCYPALKEFAPGVSQEAVEDSFNNLGLAIRFDQKLYPVRETAYKSLLDRAKISGSGLNKLTKDELAQVLNTFLGHFRSEALKKSCTKAKGNRKLQVSKRFVQQRAKSLARITSEQGILLRINRSIQSEGAFGVIKQDYGFRQFLLRGHKKVRTEILLVAMAYNITSVLRVLNRYGADAAERASEAALASSVFTMKGFKSILSAQSKLRSARKETRFDLNDVFCAHADEEDSENGIF